MEEVQARHRREQRELQGKITSKKKNATKKTRKGINDECARLEHELNERQSAEVEALAPTGLEDETATLHLDDDKLNAGDAGIVENGSALGSIQTIPYRHNGEAVLSEHEDQDQAQSQSRKPNRQKARLARRAAEQQAQIDDAATEAASMPDQRQQELSAMKAQMQKRGLVETMIRPDGHCLYSACAQTLVTDKSQDFKTIRSAAADFMNAHQDDFAPFMEEPIESYTYKIKDTAEWGGHLELQAISRAFSVSIHVLQADGHVDILTPHEPTDTVIWLAYYRHSFGLGEHYNALRKAAVE